MEAGSRMYRDTKTWNPFKGCRFDCVYCKPSFQLQAKRQKRNCSECFDYTPHQHPERLGSIPSVENIFVCGNSDISFCEPSFTLEIIKALKRHNKRCPQKTYYFQSKRPAYFTEFLHALPANVILLTTLETNRDADYGKFSKAPPPSARYRQFCRLQYPRKVVTVEPVMEFDTDVFVGWLVALKPEYVWLGYNSRPGSVVLPEPSPEEFVGFVNELHRAGVTTKLKDIRGLFSDPGS